MNENEFSLNSETMNDILKRVKKVRKSIDSLSSKNDQNPPPIEAGGAWWQVI